MDRLRLASTWGISAVLHAVLVLVLAYWTLPLAWSSHTTELLVSYVALGENGVEELATMATEAANSGAEAATWVSPLHGNDVVPDPALHESATADINSAAGLLGDTRPNATDALGGLSYRQLRQEIIVKAVPAPTDPRGGVRSASGAVAALEAVLGDIRRRATEDDLLVVWLFDASHSLVDDREQIGRRLEPFFNNEIKRPEAQTGHIIQSAAVAFGATTEELVKPTKFGGYVAAAVRQVPIDPTGLENVMEAVQSCVAKYRQQNLRWRGGVQIVIWTDESGNDVELLEETIALCRSEGVVVSVVGPSAVLGAERGLHHYIDPGSGASFLLPVDRGPASPLPERLLLPYWFDEGTAVRQKAGALVGNAANWYGGPLREGLLSGFGPYALTRLALETGGTFTLLDRSGDGVAFNAEKMQNYLPEYQSIDHYRRSLDYHPLRKAVMAAVSRINAASIKYQPTLEFFGEQLKTYPYATFKIYMLPGEFQLKLAAQMATERQLSIVALLACEQALAAFGPGGMEAAYRSEDSPRWRAWYDVTRGRLLAASVRLGEYQLACDAVLTGQELSPLTNWLALRPDDALRGGERAKARLAEARRLLERCTSEHEGTPWALLAEWELADPMGLAVVQDQLLPPLPGPPGLPALPALPITLPNF